MTRHNFIAGPNNSQGNVATWVFQNIKIDVNSETINNDKTKMEENNMILGTLHAYQENYKIFNGTTSEMNEFMNMNSPWCLIYVIATSADGNKEPHILSCHRRKQTVHYYPIELVAQKVLLFRCPDLTHLANNLFTETGWSNQMNQLREYGPFADVSPLKLNGEVACFVIVPKICLKNPSDEYSTIGIYDMNTHFSNLPLNDGTSELDVTQPCGIVCQCKWRLYCWFVETCCYEI